MNEHPIIFSTESVRAILDGRKTQTRRVMKPQNPCLPAGWQCCGNRLWVREAWRPMEWDSIAYKADNEDIAAHYTWKSPMFMPRKYSRLTLETVNIRCERLQDISSGDCIAEGYDRMGFVGHDFAAAWDTLNKKRGFGWDTNPYVWVLEFKLLKGDQ